MSLRTTRWLWFLGVWLMLPWPMLLFANAWVPAVRYLLLTLVSLTVGVFEGAAGPVPMIILLFALHATVYTAAAWGMAWGASRALGGVAPGARGWLTLGALATALALSLAFDVYRTPFGTAPVGNLLRVLS
jgi:hypothetical protein